MTGHHWLKLDNLHIYGHIKNNKLINTKGIEINESEVLIAQFNENGTAIRPCIRCDAIMFYTRE